MRANYLACSTRPTKSRVLSRCSADLLTKALPAARIQELGLIGGLADRSELIAGAVAEHAVFRAAEAGVLASTCWPSCKL